MTKLLLIVVAAVALANSFAADRSDPPMLIDSQPSPTTSLDARN